MSKQVTFPLLLALNGTMIDSSLIKTKTTNKLLYSNWTIDGIDKNGHANSLHIRI